MGASQRARARSRRSRRRSERFAFAHTGNFRLIRRWGGGGRSGWKKTKEGVERKAEGGGEAGERLESASRRSRARGASEEPGAPARCPGCAFWRGRAMRKSPPGAAPRKSRRGGRAPGRSAGLARGAWVAACVSHRVRGRKVPLESEGLLGFGGRGQALSLQRLPLFWRPPFLPLPSRVPLFCLPAGPAQGGGAVKVSLARGSQVQLLGGSAARVWIGGGGINPFQGFPRTSEGEGNPGGRERFGEHPCLRGLAQTAGGWGVRGV